MFMIALLSISLLLVLFLLLLSRTPPSLPPSPPSPPSLPLPVTPQPLPIRHVSFSDASCSPPISPSTHRRWSSPFHKRRPSLSDPPLDHFRQQPTSSPRRLPIPLRLSLPTKRRSSSASYTSDLIHPHEGHVRVPSAPSTPASLSSPPPHRTKFVNPFGKHARSRTLSPPRSLKSPDTPSSPQSTARRTLVNKFKSIFKSAPSQSSPIIQSNPIVNTINTRFRRKPVPRTQPYGPPWNAPMPVPDFSLSQHSLPNSAYITSPISRKGRKRSTPPRALTLPGQVSPRIFITELDEKLSLLQQQRIQDIIPSSHP